MSQKSVIVLAYSNDHDAYLDMIVRERKSVYRSLRPYHDKDYIQVEKAEHTSIDDFFEIFQRYNNRISIFHYGGHASGEHLQLEGSTGSENANAEGLSALIGQQKNLQLVFLNGCATRGQVQSLLDAGVKSVIATSVAINDTKATEFAEQFYRGLAGQANIQNSFNSAVAFLKTKYSGNEDIGTHRGLRLKRNTKTEKEALPWGLYTNDPKVLKWQLPKKAHNRIELNQNDYKKKAPKLNLKLIQLLFKELANNSPEAEFLLAEAKRLKKMDIRRVRQVIVDSFPAPIGEQLRKLFASNKTNVQRLKQLVRTYDVTIQLLCFSMFSQLWDERIQDKDFGIREEDLVDFNGFLSINPGNHSTFDYSILMIAVRNIFTKQQMNFFIDEIDFMVKALNSETPIQQAHLFMMEMKKELEEGRIPAEEIVSFCMQAEAKLTTIMCGCAYLVKYKLVTIKEIEIIKRRNKKAVYKHSNVMLDRVTAGVLDDILEYETPTDDRSVILFKNIENEKEYLNLTPFVIDENALTGNEKSKLYYYSYKNNESYVYQFIDDADESLEISDHKFEDIAELMDQFQKTIFQKEEALVNIDDDDDFSFEDDDDDDDDFMLFE